MMGFLTLEKPQEMHNVCYRVSFCGNEFDTREAKVHVGLKSHLDYPMVEAEKKGHRLLML